MPGWPGPQCGQMSHIFTDFRIGALQCFRLIHSTTVCRVGGSTVLPSTIQRFIG